MTSSTDNVYAIILAAGASRRLGSPKQLLKWRGSTLLEHSLSNVTQILPGRIVVVLGAHADDIQAANNLDLAKVIINHDWQEGIASSIRAGIETLPVSADASLFLLCDQPLIEDRHVQWLLNAWRNEPNRIVASQYRHGVGVPALFPAVFFDQLKQLKGDHGAKRLLMEQQNNLLKIPLPEAELDVDSSVDFESLTKRIANCSGDL